MPVNKKSFGYKMKKAESKKATRMDKSSITKLIKTTLQKNTEKKIFTDYATNFAITTAASSTPTFRSLLPLISQGAAKSQRIGNDIRVTKAILNVFVNLLPNNGTTNVLTTPTYVKIWVLRYKLENSANLNGTTAASNFFETNNSSIPFQGSMLDMALSVDTELWEVFEERICKLGAADYGSGGGLTNNTGYFDNSPMSQRFVIDVTKGFKGGKVVYNDNASTTPTNCNLYVVWQAVAAAGTNSTAQQLAEYHIGYKLEYVDM